jgi:hypothetical protein
MNSNWKVFLGAFALGIAVAAGVFFLASGDRTPPPASATATPAAVVSEVRSEVKEAAGAGDAEEAVDSSTPAPAPVRNYAPAPARKPAATVAPRPSPSVPPVASVEPLAPAPKPQPAPAAAPEPAPVAKGEPPAPAAPVVEPAPAAKTEPPKPRQARSITIPDGTLLNVSLSERVSSDAHVQGDTFSAVLTEPVIVEGLVIAEKNARVSGKVVDAQRAGKVKGLARLTLELTHLITSDDQRIAIHTAQFVKQADHSKKEDAKKVGIGAAVGAAIGAIAGGGKGAAIGAGAGAGAGAGSVLLTRGEEAELPVETRLSFRLTQDVKLTEKLK